MVSVLDSGLSGPGSGPGRGHCVLFSYVACFRFAVFSFFAYYFVTA